jgi:murein L,D-transpeptidase YcbB/YkuD
MRGLAIYASLLATTLVAHAADPLPILDNEVRQETRDGSIVNNAVPSVDASANIHATPLVSAPEILFSARVADEIKTIIAGARQPHMMAKLSRHEWEALSGYYARRDGAPLWLGGDGLADRTKLLIDRLARADEDALEPRDYPLPDLKSVGNDARVAAEADLALSAAAFAYARDARGGRIDLARLSKLITPQLDIPDVAAVLSDLAGSSNADLTLAAYNPQHPDYRRLKEKLAELRETTGSLGDHAASPARLRTTTAMVSGVPATPIDLIVNMERWRWVPRDLGARHIEANLPEFMVRVIDQGRVIHEARAIVGKPATPTPLFSARMQYLIVNPSWYVPYSIIKNEILPKLAEDPDYAAHSGYEILKDGQTLSVRQPPGERNALGLVKFMFPNQHAVYLHDTPNRKLFSETERSFSHGCVRVADPFSLAGIVLSDPKFTTESLKDMIGKGERMIRLHDPLPVHLVYFTVVPNEGGELQRFGDVYGYDQAVAAALGLSPHRAVATLR